MGRLLAAAKGTPQHQAATPSLTQNVNKPAITL
jgi:hypothetical protein